MVFGISTHCRDTQILERSDFAEFFGKKMMENLRPKKELGSKKNPPTPYGLLQGFLFRNTILFNVWLILQIMVIKWPWIVQPKKKWYNPGWLLVGRGHGQRPTGGETSVGSFRNPGSLLQSS